MIIPVKKITVVTLIDSERLILEEMGKLGVVQLRELRGDEFKGFRAESGEEEKTYDQLYERLKALHGKLSNGFYSTTVAAGADIETERLEEIIKGYEERAAELEVKLKDIGGRLDELKKAKPILDLMGEEKISPRSIGEFKHIFGKAGTIGPEDLHNLEIKLKTVKGLVYKIIPISGGEDFFFVSGLIELKPQVESILSTINHKEFKPPDELVNASPDKADDLVRSLENERDSLNKQMQELKQEFHTKYKAIESRIIELKNLSRARAKMLHSDTMAVLQGWTPEDRIPLLNSFLEKVKDRVNGRLIYSYEEPKPEDEVPSIMKNPAPFRAYEVLTRQYGYPDPKESDPTPISSILWVVMFGMMFPDSGQGLVILFLGAILAYRISRPLVGINMARVGRLMMGLGLSAMFFGLLMGEFFLMEVQPLWPGLPSPWITHSSHVLWIIKISIFFGIAQIILAMTLSIRNHLKAGERVEALLGEHGVAGLITFLGIALVAFMFLGVSVLPGVRFPRLGLGILTHWVIAVPIVGILAIFVRPIVSGEGAAMGLGLILEAFVSSLGNMLSYARIAGFAVAHAAFALVVGELLRANPALGIGLGLIFLNMFALTLELLVCMIQALRLLYYEFSTKFFKGSGIPYIPYRL